MNSESVMVMCSSSKSKILPLSTCEAEANVAVEGTKEVIGEKDLLMDFCGHTRQPDPTYIGEDNQAVITLASKEAGTHGRTNHFTGRISQLFDRQRQERDHST